MIDQAALLRDFAGDEEILREACETFLAEMDGLLGEARAALAGKDARTLELAAHTFKGAVSNFHARSAAQAAYSLEVAAKSDLLDGAEAKLAELEAEGARLAVALGGFLAGALSFST